MISISSKTTVSFLLNLIIKAYFMDHNSILVCHDSSANSPLKSDYIEAVTQHLHHIDTVAVNWVDVAHLSQEEHQQKILDSVNLGCNAYITVMANTTAFLEARYYANERQVIRQMQTRFLFLTEDENIEDLVKVEALKLFPQHLVVQPDGNTFKLNTQKYVGADNNDDVQLVDIFFANNNSFRNNADLYGNKMQNMQGRIIKIAAPYYPPYLLVDEVPSGTGNMDTLNDTKGIKNILYDGAEGRIALEFCRLRNCTMKAYMFGREGWGDILPNGTSHLSYGSLYQKQTEFVIGCVTNWYPNILDSSIAISKSAVKIIGPKPLRYPPALTPILPFSAELWGLFVLTIVACTVALFGFRYFSKVVVFKATNGHTIDLVYQSLFEVLAIFFQNCYQAPKYDTVITRMILAVLLLAAMTLENSYSGQLKSVLTVPVYLDPVDSIEKFTKTDWKWAALTMEWINSLLNSDIEKEVIMTEKFQALDFDEMNKLSLGGAYGFGVEKLTCGKFTFGRHIRDCPINDFIMLKDELYYYYTQALSIRGWPLMQEFNKVAQWCVEHGLHLYWESQFTDFTTDTVIEQILLKLEAGHAEKDPPEVIRMSHIAGIFFALFFGYLMAFAALLIEICAKRMSNSNKCRRNQKLIGRKPTTYRID